ncbi:hypothetical protein JCM10212_000775 [Sporobolomyces blumeae]
MARTRQQILDEVMAAKARHTSSSSLPLASPPSNDSSSGSFTNEALDILNQAFDSNEKVTRAEVQQLSTVTGLSARQFANQRQRRHKKRAAPYSLGPRNPPSSKTAAPRRNVSGSSSDSSLISYSDSSASDDFDSAREEYPGDLRVESSEPYYPPAPDSASFEHFAQQFHITPTATYSNDHADVPMMSFSGPSPVAPTFALPPNPSSIGYQLPPPPPTALTDTFFGIDHAPAPPSVVSPLDSHDWQSAASSPFASPQPQSESSSTGFFDHLRSTDPFLDDPFLKNVFGNLDVSADGGLTLSMDALQEEGANAITTGAAGGGGVPHESTGSYSFGW